MSNKTSQDSPVDPDLLNDIMLRLQQNNNLSNSERISEVMKMLCERASSKQIVFYAAEFFLLLENQQLIEKAFKDWDDSFAKGMVMTISRETARIEGVEKDKKSKNGRKGGNTPKKPDITKEVLEKFRDEFYLENATTHGWKKAAKIKYRTSTDTIRKRLSE